MPAVHMRISSLRVLLTASVAAMTGLVACQSSPATATGTAQALPAAVTPLRVVERGERPIEATSLLGEPLRRPMIEPEKSARLEEDLAQAKSRADSQWSEETAIWLGRRLSYLGRYRDAIAVYSRAIDSFGATPRLLRHRGHRFITLRELDRARVDLESAQRLGESLPVEIEPDGIPTPAGPRTTLQGNIDYHLALALFLSGDLTTASHAWRRALERSENDDSRVAATYWLSITEFERGKPDAARAALERIVPDMDVRENSTYHRLCLALDGKLAAESLAPVDSPLGLGVDRATLGFGLAMHARHVERNEALALRRLRENANLPEWASFGVIASEATLAK